jgi:hypothetical protein
MKGPGYIRHGKPSHDARQAGAALWQLPRESSPPAQIVWHEGLCQWTSQLRKALVGPGPVQHVHRLHHRSMSHPEQQQHQTGIAGSGVEAAVAGRARQLLAGHLATRAPCLLPCKTLHLSEGSSGGQCSCSPRVASAPPTLISQHSKSFSSRVVLVAQNLHFLQQHGCLSGYNSTENTLKTCRSAQV